MTRIKTTEYLKSISRMLPLYPAPIFRIRYGTANGGCLEKRSEQLIPEWIKAHCAGRLANRWTAIMYLVLSIDINKITKWLRLRKVRKVPWRALTTLSRQLEDFLYYSLVHMIFHMIWRGGNKFWYFKREGFFWGGGREAGEGQIIYFWHIFERQWYGGG